MVPQKCDGPCQRVLMIWDVTRFWCRQKVGFGEVHLCDDCIPQDRIKQDKNFNLTLVRINDVEKLDLKSDPLADEEEVFIPGFTEPEPGSEVRYDKRKAEHPWFKHTAWWFIHNCVAHVLIGVLPLKPFFEFHDWTSRKMHGK